MKKIIGILAFLFLVSPALADVVSPSASALIKRAEKFQKLGLMTLAREQYLYIQRVYPQEKSVLRRLDNLSRNEVKLHEHNTFIARKLGALKLAALEAQKTPEADPANPRLKTLYQDVMKELTLKQSLEEQVSKEYLAGLSFYQSGKWDKALECFVRTLNLYPTHAGALRYIEKIDERSGHMKP